MANTFLQSPPMGWNSWDCYGASVREDETYTVFSSVTVV